MSKTGIAVGIIAFLLVRAIVAEAVSPVAQAGDFPGLVVAIWAAWPFFYRHKIKRFNLLNPVPKQYPLTFERAFRDICTVIKSQSYGYGDKWQIVEATEELGKITQDLQFVEQASSFSFPPFAKKEQLRRYIKLDVEIREIKEGTVIVRFCFDIKAEGSTDSCDSIIATLMKAVEAKLGRGLMIGQPKSAELPVPPRWLLATTAGMLLFLLMDVVKAVFMQ